MPVELEAPTNLTEWYETNKDLFSPPVCNKLMHKVQLNVMFVGGPNQRTDFHLDLGSEFFFQVPVPVCLAPTLLACGPDCAWPRLC